VAPVLSTWFKDAMTLISAYIITRDEERNIGRAIRSVAWMDEVVVLDSGSVDRTCEIARDLGAVVHFEEFRGFIAQKNRAMELCRGEWLFNLDADEEMTAELRDSIRQLLDIEGPDERLRGAEATAAQAIAASSAMPGDGEAAVIRRQSGERHREQRGPRDKIARANQGVYEVCRRTWYLGRWIRHCGWYPEYRERLSQRGTARWEGEAVHERLIGHGAVGRLKGDLLHRPYDSIADHARKVVFYADLWAQRERGRGRRATTFDLAFRPLARFSRMYLFKAGFLDGSPGLVAAFMGGWYAFMKYARLRELQDERADRHRD